MKKLFLLLIIFAAAFTTVQAQQGGGDPAAMMARMKERIKPQLIDKTKLTDAQADKVIEINFEQQQARRQLRMDQSLSDDDKKKKMADLDAARNKKLSEIPLTNDQVKSVNDFFEEMRKNMQQQRGNQ